jgi:hypothetical protein
VRMGRLAEADPVFALLADVEPEDSLKPDAVSLPGDPEPAGSGGRSHDFGCHAYYQQVRVIYHCAAGNIQRALAAARHLIDGRSACELTLCASAPREALATLLEPLASAGYVNEAERAHARGLPLVKGRATSLGLLGHHLRYLSRHGRRTRAVALMPAARGLRNRASSPFQVFHFLRGVAAVLCVSPDRVDSEDACLCLDEAAAIAARFDCRNGNAYFTALLNEDAK